MGILILGLLVLVLVQVVLVTTAVKVLVPLNEGNPNTITEAYTDDQDWANPPYARPRN